MIKKIFKMTLLVGISFQAVSLADSSSTCSFMTDLAQEEGGSYGQTATNSQSTASGQYQTTVAAMQDCGLIASSNLPSGANSKTGYDQYVTWTNNQFGVTSEASYLSNSAAQTYCAQNFASNAYSRLNANTLSYIGKNIPGTNSTVTESGLVACAYYAGAGNCNSFFSGGSTGSATTDLLIKRMENAGPLDASCVTGNTDNTQYSGATNPVSSTATSSGMYCFSNVSQLMSQYGQQQVETWKTVAGTPGIGYSTMNGGNINEAAGIDTTTGLASSSVKSDFWSRNLQGAQYSAYSCLENIMNSGIDSFFHLPSINDIKSAIASMICTQAENLYNDAVTPINSALSQTTNLGNVGGFLPAVGLGNLGGGIQIQQGQGSLLNVNGQSATGNSSLTSAVNSTSFGQNLNSALTGATNWYTDESAYVGNTINSNMASFQNSIYNSVNSNN